MSDQYLRSALDKLNPGPFFVRLRSGQFLGGRLRSTKSRWLVGALVVLCLLPLSILAVRFLYSGTTRNGGVASATQRKPGFGFLGVKKPKPAPGKLMSATAQSIPAAPVTRSIQPPSNPSPASPNQEPATVLPALPPSTSEIPATVPGRSQPSSALMAGTATAPVVYPARHDKLFGSGCSGKITLNSAGLTFDCPEDRRDSITIPASEIGAVDDNGFRLLSGKKYHFSIPGMTKDGEERLFANWLHNVRRLGG